MAMKRRTLKQFTEHELDLLLGRKSLPQQSSHQLKLVEKDERHAKLFTPSQLLDFMDLTYLSLPLFPSEEMLSIAITNRPWALRFQGSWKTDKSHELFYQSQIWRGCMADMTIDWLGHEIGYGAFSNQHIATSDFVAAYTGVVRRVPKRWPDTNAYCMNYPTRAWTQHVIVIDSIAHGNETRFINHSDQPNLELGCTCDRGLLFFYLTAKLPISKGSQLTFDYGQGYWENRRKWAL